MVGRTKNLSWRTGFYASVKTTLKDSRLWIIVLPSLALCGLALAFLSTGLATLATTAVVLVASRLLNNIEEIPKPDGLVESFYRAVALPAMVGAFISD
jgi:hypothetical protein